ncbi:Protein of unknown function [Bacillus wiedmannii]|uniref:Uncharacterized protein n=1 Tax=Bacillus wiedmannii TaxID=1890302 RepID=A0A1C4ENL8_9BACI|nr:Protein of unknown function [Bacillus wiedmannii]
MTNPTPNKHPENN